LSLCILHGNLCLHVRLSPLQRQRHGSGVNNLPATTATAAAAITTIVSVLSGRALGSRSSSSSGGDGDLRAKACIAQFLLESLDLLLHHRDQLRLHTLVRPGARPGVR